MLLSDTSILVIWSVKYHFTEVMTTDLEKIFDFFQQTLYVYNISDTKVFKYCESHFLMLMLKHFETDPARFSFNQPNRKRWGAQLVDVKHLPHKVFLSRQHH